MPGEPRYLRVERDLTARVKVGEWAPDEFLPSESELQDYYRVSRTTIRRAIADLVSSGILVIERGNGTRVVAETHHTSGVQVFSFAAAVTEQGMTPGTRECTADLVTNEAGVRMIHLQRVMTADEDPISVADSWLEADQFAGVPLDVLTRTSSLYQTFAQLGLPITEVTDHYGVTTADEAQADLLGVGIGQPLLQIDRTARSAKTVVETGRIVVSTDRFRPTIITRS